MELLAQDLSAKKGERQPITPLENLLFERGTLDGAVSPQLWEAYQSAHFSNADNIVATLEDGVVDGAITENRDIYITSCLALRLRDPSENSMRQICRAIRRSLKHQKAPGILTRHEKWERESAQSIIGDLDEALMASGDAVSLKAFYEQHYADKTYDEIKEEDGGLKADEVTQVIIGGKKITVKFWTDNMATASPRLLVHMVAAIIKNYDSVQDLAEEGLESALTSIRSPEHLLYLAMGIDYATRWGGGSVASEFGEKFRTRAHGIMTASPASAWRTFNWFQWVSRAHPGVRPKAGNKNAAYVFDVALKQIPAVSSEFLVEGFLAEPDIIMSWVGYEKMSNTQKIRDPVNQKLFSSPELLKNDLLLRKIILVVRKFPALRSELARYVTRRSIAPDKVSFIIARSNAESVLAQAGVDSEDIDRWVKGADEIFRRRSGIAAPGGLGSPGAELAAPKIRQPRTRKPGATFGEHASEAIREGAFSRELRPKILAAAGFLDGLRRDAAALLSDGDLIESTWEGAQSVATLCPPNSPLARLGVKAIQLDFPEGERASVEFIFSASESGNGHGDAAARKEEKVIIDESGSLVLGGLPSDVAWAAPAIEVEVLTALMRNEIGPMLVQLGFDEFRPDPAPPPATPPNPDDEPGEENVEKKTPEERTRAFFAKNAEAFRAYIDKVKGQKQFDIPGTYLEIASIFTELQASIARNGLSRGIPSGGAPILPLKDHILAPTIELLDVYPVPATRQTFRDMGIVPAAFHGAEDLLDEHGELDAYLVVLHAKMSEKETQQIVACVLPPRFDVYILGVDPTDWDEAKDVTSKALSHLVLEAFRSVAGREYSTENTRSSISTRNAKEGSAWVVQMRDIIEKIALARYPTIVMERIKRPDDACEEIDALSRSAEPRKRNESVGRTYEEKQFWKILTEGGDFAQVLSFFGACLSVPTYAKFMPDAGQVIPSEALASRDGIRTARQGWERIYIPLDAAHVKVAIGLLGKEGDFTLEDFRIITTEHMGHRMPFEISQRAMSDRDVYPFIFDGTDEPVIIVPGTRAAISKESPDTLLKGERRRPPMNFAAKVQNPYHQARSGQEIKLEPKICALLVWEFEDGPPAAFRYLDAMRDVPHRKNLTRISGAERLMKYSPNVDDAIQRTRTENISGSHTDFTNWKDWKPWDIPRLEKEGIIEATRDARSVVTGVNALRKVRRKKVVILQEHVGYWQFQIEPSNFAQLVDFGSENGVDVLELMGYTQS